MKRLFSIIMMVVLAMPALLASTTHTYTVTPKNVDMKKEGSLMTVNMNLDLRSLGVSSNRAVVITPVIRKGANSMELKSVGVYGKRRYIQYQRVYGGMITGADEISFKASKAPADYNYQAILPYKSWMGGSTLELHISEYGCCRSVVAENVSKSVESFASVNDVKVVPAFVMPKAETVKHRSLAGRAYIDFPVNATTINPNYRRNPQELAKIKSTIDSINNDKDITVKSLALKGYASPEGPWAKNYTLAKGRTTALKNYVMGLYHFNPAAIHTSSQAEDWEGLRNYVANSDITSKSAILDIINSEMEPDAREWKLKSTYPKEYRFLLDNVYPGLRHSDYVLEYDIRSYSDPAEIAKVFSTQPQKLSLNELYILANSYPQDSQKFAEVFETAAKMYPTDATANLNAANAALLRGDNSTAERYIAKAGNTPQAAYARGILAAKKGDKNAALNYLKTAQMGGVAQAKAAMDYINKAK